jgi:hypothetical protein
MFELIHHFGFWEPHISRALKSIRIPSLRISIMRCVWPMPNAYSRRDVGDWRRSETARLLSKSGRPLPNTHSAAREAARRAIRISVEKALFREGKASEAVPPAQVLSAAANPIALPKWIEFSTKTTERGFLARRMGRKVAGRRRRRRRPMRSCRFLTLRRPPRTDHVAAVPVPRVNRVAVRNCRHNYAPIPVDVRAAPTSFLVMGTLWCAPHCGMKW